MQPIISIERKTTKRPKSATTFPKKLPTYIVAFAVNENIKKPSSEDVILNKSSRQNSGTSVAPSTSTITITKTSQQSMGAAVGDKEPDKMLTETKENIGDNINEAHDALSKILYFLNINETTAQPQVIFNAQKQARKSQFDDELIKRKSKKNKRVVKVKNIKFKIHRAGNMTTKLTRYCKKTYKTFDSPREIQKELDSETISKRVSRTRVLKKVLAKENLLADAENSNTNFFRTSPFATNPSIINSSSQNTLTSRNSPNSINSVIQISNAKAAPYKTDIINVAVVQISNMPNISRNSVTIITPQNANYKDSLTSYESAFSQTILLTSKTSLEDSKSYTKNTSDAGSSKNTSSNDTLIPPKTKSGTSYDIFAINSSCLHESNILSDSLKKNTNNEHVSELKENHLHTRPFHNACMSLNIYPKTIRRNSVPDLPKNDNVIIAEDITKTSHQIHKMSKGIEHFENTSNDFYTNIFKKPLNVVNDADYQKNLNLPNAAKIKHTMVDTFETQRKCSEEVRDTYPTSFPELCEKLTIIFETAIKKLEQTLSEKIMNELKISLHGFDKRFPSSPTNHEEANINTFAVIDPKLESLTQSIIQETPHADAYLQCQIVQNEVIDNLMIACSEEFAKSYVQSSSSIYTHKLKTPKIVKNCVKVLKAPIPSRNKEEEGKGDLVQISIEDAVEQQMPRFANKKKFWPLPIITIIRENMFVVTSVPAFLFVMFVIYSYVMLIARMWWY